MNAIRFQFQFDAPRIYKELQAIAASLKTIHSIKIKENHLMGLHLIVPNADGKKEASGYTYISTPELDQSPYLQSILETFQCNKFTYRVHNLVTGGKIALHRDTDRGLINNFVRIHIPVSSNEEVYFHVNGERICMQNGECWFADVTQLHEVENRSNSDRLQLLIDCDLNDWWKEILKKHSVQLEEDLVWKHHSLEELQLMKKNFLHMGIENQAIIEKIEQEISLKSLS